MTNHRPLLLYVEDEALVALAVVMELEEAGFDVEHATSGKGGLDAIESNVDRFAALITDVRLPEVDGWMIARRARELRRELAVVYVSGDSAINWASEGVPGSVMLQKPFSNEVLLRTLAGVVGEKAVPPFEEGGGWHD